MEIKTAEELNHEIKAATDIEDYLRQNRENMLTQNLSQYLEKLLAQKGLNRAQVIRGSLLDRTYTYQIFSGEKSPSRDKLLALAFGLGLTDEETQKMLKISYNRELYVRDARDALILFALQHRKTILEVNESLYDHGFTVLGSSY